MPIHTQSPTHTCLYVQAELENLGHIPGVNPAFLAPSSPPSLTPSLPHTSALTTHLTLTVQDVEGEGEGEVVEAEDGEQQDGDGKPADGILSLVPPSSLFNPPERHPLHIFVSSYNALCTIHLCLVSLFIPYIIFHLICKIFHLLVFYKCVYLLIIMHNYITTEPLSWSAALHVSTASLGGDCRPHPPAPPTPPLLLHTHSPHTTPQGTLFTFYHNYLCKICTVCIGITTSGSVLCIM